MKPTLLVLAAGMGSRYGSLKQIDKLGPSGETIMDYSVFDAQRAGFGKVVFVIRKDIEDQFKQFVLSKLEGKIPAEYVFQEISNAPQGVEVPPEREKPWGTAHAVLVAAEKINEPFAVINADDFYGHQAYQTIAGFLTSLKPYENNKYCMVGYQLANTLSDFGYVSRGICRTDKNQCLTSVTERTQIEKRPKGIAFKDQNDLWQELSPNDTVSMNFWGFTPSFFDHCREQFKEFIQANANNPKAEFYIPSVVSRLIGENKASVKVLQSDAQWFGVTYKQDKTTAIERIKSLVEQGIYPQKLF